MNDFNKKKLLTAKGQKSPKSSIHAPRRDLEKNSENLKLKF